MRIIQIYEGIKTNYEPQDEPAPGQSPVKIWADTDFNPNERTVEGLEREYHPSLYRLIEVL